MSSDLLRSRSARVPSGNELLLQEDELMFLLQCEHLFTPSNFTPAALLFATSEGKRYRSYGGSFRTDILSSQYSMLLKPFPFIKRPSFDGSCCQVNFISAMPGQ